MTPTLYIGGSLYASPGYRVGSLTINQRSGRDGSASFRISATTAQHAATAIGAGDSVEVRSFDNQPSNEAIQARSTDTTDVSRAVLIVGLSNTGTTQYATVTTNGDAGDTWVDVPTYTNWSRILTVSTTASFAGTIQVRIKTAPSESIVTLAPGVKEAHDRRFRGVVRTLSRVFAIPNSATTTQVEYGVDARHIGDIATRRLINRRWFGDAISDIVADLMADALTAEGIVTSWGGVSTIDTTIGAVTIADLSGLYRPIADVLDDIAEAGGGIWWIDNNLVLHLQPTAASGTAPLSVTQTAGVRNVNVSEEFGPEYRNTQHIIFPALAANYEQTLDGDGSARSFRLNVPIGEMVSVVVSSDTRQVAENGDKRFIDLSGGGFVGVPLGEPQAEAVQLVSDDPTDTRTITIIGEPSLGSQWDDVQVEAVVLTGTTPVWTAAGNWIKVFALKASATRNATVTATGYLYEGAIGTIAPNVASTAVVAATGTDVWIKPFAYADAAEAGELAMKYRRSINGTTTYQKLTLDGTSEVSAEDCVLDITEFYVGNISASRTITAGSHYEWSYQTKGTNITQDASSDVMIGVGVLVVTYKPSYQARVVSTATDAALETISDRQTAEGGTGIYEGVERQSACMEVADAQARADAMIDQFARVVRTLTFGADIDGWYIGQTISATLTVLDVSSATKFIVSGVGMKSRNLIGTDAYAHTWEIEAVDTNYPRDRWARWRRMLAKPKESEYINPDSIPLV